MEEIIQMMDEFMATSNSNTDPIWISIFGIFVPILISIAVLVITIVQHYQNKKLQSAICNRECAVQMHNDILRIYDDFCLAQQAIGSTGGKSYLVFSNFTVANGGVLFPEIYVNNLNSALNTICQAMNRAKLLLPKSDKKLRITLENVYDKYKTLKFKVDAYYYGGTAQNVANTAWQKIANGGFGVVFGDYVSLRNNDNAFKFYLESCKTTTTKEIDDMTNELLELFEYDKFDIFFEKYLQMNFIEGDC